jgi:integrase
VLSPAEVLHFLECVGSLKHRAILTACYAAGLRISEAVHLKPNDVDSQRMVIHVKQGKGQKDRYVMLSPRLLEILRNYWRKVRPKQWLFEGYVSGHPITRDAVAVDCEHYSTAKASRTLASHSSVAGVAGVDEHHSAGDHSTGTVDGTAVGWHVVHRVEFSCSVKVPQHVPILG